MKMKWYYCRRGDHVHVRVFTDSALNGTLVFRESEFSAIRDWHMTNNLSMIWFFAENAERDTLTFDEATKEIHIPRDGGQRH